MADQNPQGAENVINPNEPPSVALLFTEDMMRYVMTQYELSWESSVAAHRFRETVSTAFIPEIGLAMASLTKKYIDAIKDIYNQDPNPDVLPVEDFKSIARSIGLKCFQDGYSAYEFLKFCSQVTYLAVIFFQEDVRDVPNVAVKIIEETLRNNFQEQFDSEGRWESLYEECSRILGVQVMGER